MYIIATVGPKTLDKWIIKELMENGINILRFNCSHFNKDDFEKVIVKARNINKNIKILVDLCGKKIRVSKELKYIYKIYNNQEIYFCGEDLYKKIDISKYQYNKIIPLNIKTNEIEENNIEAISIKDNTMKFKIISKENGIIKAKVLKGGIIRSGKGCNLSNLNIRRPILSEEDEKYALWAIKNSADIICQSFVESQKEIEILEDIIKKQGSSKIEIWAKVETPKGIDNLDEIFNKVDTIVLGRGDLVPEAGILQAVKLQDLAIKKAKINNKKIIVATRLLNSMKNGQCPNINEIEGIYYFLKNNVDGFLLAGETSIGKAPVETVALLNKAIKYYNS
ncbi:pyruvate kinase [Clostridium isatidis]|uniref:Pyruvate kinase n=2 Tax=Clostridium isatidis TaxID=182773 RepID=A0A343JAD7_9CLOT|nr:pyruvate kinase [Clostridium isatidis]